MESNVLPRLNQGHVIPLVHLISAVVTLALQPHHVFLFVTGKMSTSPHLDWGVCLRLGLMSLACVRPIKLGGREGLRTRRRCPFFIVTSFLIERARYSFARLKLWIFFSELEMLEQRGRKVVSFSRFKVVQSEQQPGVISVGWMEFCRVVSSSSRIHVSRLPACHPPLFPCPQLSSPSSKLIAPYSWTTEAPFLERVDPNHSRSFSL